MTFDTSLEVETKVGNFHNVVWSGCVHGGTPKLLVA